MIRYATGADQPGLMEMWKLCFPSDSGNFRKFYFDRVYRSEETLAFLESNRPVASLQMIPYQMKIHGKSYVTGYISGAMTHPEFQRRGYMNSLLQIAFEEMRKNKFSFSFLIPQEDRLFSYYARYGYEKAFPRKKIVLKPEITLPVDPEIRYYDQYPDEDSCGLLYDLYRRFLDRMNNVVLKSREQFQNILVDLFLDEGAVFAGESAMALVIARDASVQVKELLYSDDESRKELLAAIGERNPGKDLEITLSGCEEGIYYGMLKSFDVSFNLPPDIYMSMMLD